MIRREDTARISRYIIKYFCKSRVGITVNVTPIGFLYIKFVQNCIGENMKTSLVGFILRYPYWKMSSVSAFNGFSLLATTTEYCLAVVSIHSGGLVS